MEPMVFYPVVALDAMPGESAAIVVPLKSNPVFLCSFSSPADYVAWVFAKTDFKNSTHVSKTQNH